MNELLASVRQNVNAQKRFIAGCAIAFAVLVPIATAYGGGVSTWTGFVSNSEKHLSTPLTNNMGWKTVVAWVSVTVHQDS